MIKLKDFISAIIEASQDLPVSGITFDLGVEPNMNVNPKSPNRVKFSVRKNDIFDAFDFEVADSSIAFRCKKCNYMIIGGLRSTELNKSEVRKHYASCKK